MEPIIITTPVTNTVVKLKPFITGRDEQAIQAVYLDGTKVQAGGANSGSAELNAIMAQVATNKTIGIVVISVNDSTDDVVNKVLDLPSKDFNFVTDKIDEITSPIDQKKSSK